MTLRMIVTGNILMWLIGVILNKVVINASNNDKYNKRLEKGKTIQIMCLTCWKMVNVNSVFLCVGHIYILIIGVSIYIIDVIYGCPLIYHYNNIFMLPFAALGIYHLFFNK